MSIEMTFTFLLLSLSLLMSSFLRLLEGSSDFSGSGSGGKI